MIEDPQKDRTVTCRARFCENGGKVKDMVPAKKILARTSGGALRGYFCPSCAANAGRRTMPSIRAGR
jgi:hypothetical protein